MKVKHLGYGLVVCYLMWSLWWISVHGHETLWSGGFLHQAVGFLACLGTIVVATLILTGVSVIFLLIDTDFWNKKLF